MPAPKSATSNAVVGQIKTYQDALRVSLALAEEDCKPIDEEKRRKAKAATEAAYKKREEAFAKVMEKNQKLNEQLSVANRALRRQDMGQDLVDLGGAALNLVGLFTPLGWGVRAVSAGVGIANDYARPDPPGLLEAGNQTLGVAGLAPERIGARVIVRPLVERAGGVGGIIGGVASANGDAMSLALREQTLDALKDFREQLSGVKPTRIQSAFGLDKDKLMAATDEAIAAEEEYQRAHEEWARALRAETALTWDSTCVSKRQSEILPTLFDPHAAEMRMMEEIRRKRAGG